MLPRENSACRMTRAEGDHRLSLLYPEEGIQRAVLHEFRDNHDGAALGDNPVQADDIWMLKLPHDAGLAQKLPTLLIGVACLQGLDGHCVFSLPWRLQASKAHLSKLSCQGKGWRRQPCQREQEHQLQIGRQHRQWTRPWLPGTSGGSTRLVLG